jgi:hypothetical protein
MQVNIVRLLLLSVLLPCVAVPLAAQARTRPAESREGGVPRDVAREVAATWNAPATRRVRGAFTLPATDTIAGDLAILDGPATIDGVVLGRVVAMNTDVLLGATARIDGDLTIVGGVLSDRSRGDVRGDVRAWRARFRFHETDGELIPESDRDIEARWRRWRRVDSASYTRSELFVTSAHSYNRVEGLPIYVGPRLRARNGDTHTTVDLFGIFRTGERLVWEPDNLGHRVRAELRQGRGRGVAVGGRLFDEVDAVERWTLSDGEVGLASFLLTRDFRDYWRRHGASAYLSAYADERTSLTAGFGEERWSSRRARDPWSLIDDKVPWRANPAVDEGVLRLFTLAGRYDSRNDEEHPRTGWLVQAEYERGSGRLDVRGPTTLPEPLSLTTGDVTYGRALVDVRRYNRLGPLASLNLRAVAGGWMHGDPLPLQRRLSVSGVDALPGFDFRRLLDEADVGTCATGPETTYADLGRPAQCDRMVLVQAEWKGDFRVNLFGDDDDYGDRRWVAGRVRADGAWVVFVNSGRGWLVGDAPGDLGRSRGEVPGPGSWRTDLGGGFDFGDFGIYVAKAVSEPGLSPNVFMRLRRRF